MNKTARHNARHSAVSVFAILAPVALAAFAYEVSPDIVERTQIVQACEQVGAALVGSAGLRASYLFGINKAIDLVRSSFAGVLAAA